MLAAAILAGALLYVVSGAESRDPLSSVMA